MQQSTGLLLYITWTIAATFAITKFVRDATSHFEDSLNEETKRGIRKVVKKLAYGNGFHGSVLSLKSATDSYFGEKYFSWLSFKRSFCLTMTFFLPIFLIGIAKNWAYYYNFPSKAIAYTVIPVFIVFLIANTAIDFTSVIKSRFLLSISEGRTIWRILSISVLDILITLLIFTIIFLPLRAACVYIASAEYGSTETFIDTIKYSYTGILKNSYYFETLKSWINL